MTAYDTAILDAHLGVPSGPTQTLLAYWPLDDAAGGTSLRDASSGNIGAFPFSALRGTLGNTSIMTGDASTCLHKTETGNMQINYAGLSTAGKAAVNQTGNWAFIVWVQADTVTPADAFGRQFLFGQWDAGNSNYQYALYLTGQALQAARQKSDGTEVSLLGASLMVPNNPMMLAAVYDQVNLSIYANGILQVQGAATGAMATATGNLELGGILGGLGFKGYMQKAAFFGSAPSIAQLQSLYVVGAQTTAEVAGKNLNVYQFSRQAIGANGSRKSITLMNDSDTPMFLSLGSSPAVAHQGIRLNPNGGRWPSSGQSGPVYTGAIQVIHSNFLGAKTLLISET